MTAEVYDVTFKIVPYIN